MAERMKVLRKVYVHNDGSEGRSVKPESETLRFDFFGAETDDDDNAVVAQSFPINLREFSQNVEMAFCAMAHGLSQKLGDAVAGIAKKAAKDGVDPDPKTGYADYALEMVSDLFDDIANGVWVAEGEGGDGVARVSMWAQAIFNVKVAAGQEADLAEIKAKLKGEEYRDTAKKVPQVLAEYRKLEKERADERAAKAAEAAAKAGDAGLDAL